MATAAILFSAGALLAHGPGDREPMAEERPVIAHYAEVMRAVVAQCANGDWQEDAALTFDVKDDVMVKGSPEGPFDISQQFAHTYVRRAAALAPAKAGTHKLNRVSVEAQINMLKQPISPAPSHNEALRVQGVALAYRVKNYKYDSGTSVVLLFGQWKNARWKFSDSAYYYHFAHKGQAPVIENIVVQLDGSPERVAQLLKAVDWAKVNDALTQ